MSKEINGHGKIELSPGMKYIFIAMMQAAIRCRDMNIDEGSYLGFAKGIWEAMLLNDEDDLKEAMEEIMKEEIRKWEAGYD